MSLDTKYLESDIQWFPPKDARDEIYWMDDNGMHILRNSVRNSLPVTSPASLYGDSRGVAAVNEHEEQHIIRNRQMACDHEIIKGVSDPVKRCVRCGISEADLEQLKASQWGYGSWAGGVP